MDRGYNKTIAYVGTYTYGESEGIYAFHFDTAAGTLNPIGIVAGVENPTYLAVDKDSRYLYTVLETNQYNGQPGGAVSSFTINSPTGELMPLNCQPTHCKGPCHISIDRANDFLFAANYNEGTAMVFPIHPDGSIAPPSSTIYHQGTGPNAERQEKAHVHFVTLTPDERYLCAVDLGIDKIVLYSLDRQKGTLAPVENRSVTIKPGSGPRHMAFHPNGRFVYLINELSSDIAVMEYSSSSFFSVTQYISALPQGYAGTSYCAAIHVSSDGNYLYASNRGHDSIAIFRIDPSTGMLEPISHSPTYGEFPRDFAIDPTGRFLLAANQNSSTIVPFTIMKETGKLERIGPGVKVPNPTCIKFAHLKG